MAILAALPLGGCKDHNAPVDPRAIRNLFVGVRADSGAVHDRGEFVLALVPVDGNGQVVISPDLEITPALTAPAAQDLTPVTVVPEMPNPLPVAAAVSLDDSKSMRANDPANSRMDAARLFWTEIFAGGEANQVALLAFGGDQPTPPFERTALLQDWTREASLLESGFGRLTTAGGTNLYRSTAEIVQWISLTKAAASFRRIMLLVTDGLPTDPEFEQLALTTAVQAEIPVYTVGIGPASDQSPFQQAEAVGRLRTLSNTTRAIYAGAESSEELTQVFRSLAKVTTEGALLVTVQVTPAPAAGTTVAGTVRVANSYGGASATWSFQAR